VGVGERVREWGRGSTGSGGGREGEGVGEGERSGREGEGERGGGIGGEGALYRALRVNSWHG
jgi:hypothetical protein